MTETHEYAVMCDTFHPLRLSALARELDDPSYAYSWFEEPARAGTARRGPRRSDVAPLSARTLVVDFDGTITEQDLLDEIALTFGDEEVYREVDEGLDDRSLSLNEVIRREFEPVRAPLDEVRRGCSTTSACGPASAISSSSPASAAGASSSSRPASAS